MPHSMCRLHRNHTAEAAQRGAAVVIILMCTEHTEVWVRIKRRRRRRTVVRQFQCVVVFNKHQWVDGRHRVWVDGCKNSSQHA